MTENTDSSDDKACRIYRVQYSAPGGKVPPQSVVSAEDLVHFLRLSPAERTIGGVIYHPLRIDETWLLTMHEPLRDAFMSHVDNQGQVDVGEHPSTGHDLAHSSAVLFLSDGCSIALLKGHRSAPGAGALHDFLKEWMEPPKNHYWSVDQVLREDQVDRIMNSAGLLELTLGIAPTDDLLTKLDADEAPPLSEVASRLRSQFSPQASIEVGVKLDAKSYTPEQAHRLQRAAHQELTRPTTKPSKGSATLLGPDGEREVINVVKDHATLHIDIQGPDPDRVSFQNLAASLVSAQPEIEEFVGGFN